MHEREREGLVGWSSALTSKPSSVQYMCMTSLSVSCTDGVNVQTNANLSGNDPFFFFLSIFICFHAYSLHSKFLSTLSSFLTCCSLSFFTCWYCYYVYMQMHPCFLLAS
ncbi:hypothetical protein NC651_001438 [Populus alba x Populus x berolinensis]|nr:hypothetical protein NC651_001438 [Populus alba x Populus x berolinensis]